MMGMDTMFIYGLRDPKNGVIYYVGKSNHPEVRLRMHITRRTRYKMQNLVHCCSPEMVILERVDAEQWRERERHWIKYGRDEGWPLINVRNGGEGLTGTRNLCDTCP